MDESFKELEALNNQISDAQTVVAGLRSCLEELRHVIRLESAAIVLHDAGYVVSDFGNLRQAARQAREQLETLNNLRKKAKEMRVRLNLEVDDV